MRDTSICKYLCAAAVSLLPFMALAAPDSAAQSKRQRAGTLVKLQSLDLGGYAMHLHGVLTPAQSIVRVGGYVITIGGTTGSMAYDYYQRRFVCRRCYR